MRHSLLFFFQGQVLFLIFLTVAVLLSGAAVAFAKYESRKLFSEIESLRVHRDELVVDWGRLQIELATWAEHGRVEKIAVQQLQMQVPDVKSMMVIKP